MLQKSFQGGFFCKPEKAFMKLKIPYPIVESTNWSIFGNGKLSLGYALLRHIKSMHIIHLPFAFFTKTILEMQFEYFTSLMKPAYISLFTFILMEYFSLLKHLIFSVTGLESLLVDNLWKPTSGSIPGMSSYDQENTLEYLCKNSTNLILKSSPNLNPV